MNANGDGPNDPTNIIQSMLDDYASRLPLRTGQGYLSSAIYNRRLNYVLASRHSSLAAAGARYNNSSTNIMETFRVPFLSICCHIRDTGIIRVNYGSLIGSFLLVLTD